MQAAPDREVFDLAQVAVHVVQKVAELLGLLLYAEVPVQLGVAQRLPDPGSYGRKLRRVERLDLVVLVEQLLQPRQVVVGLGPGHRGDEVVDHDRVRPPLGLRPLARVVDDERIEQRHVTQGGVRGAGGGEPQGLAREPLQRSVFAEVYYGVGAELLDDPPVDGEVVVRRREVGVVVDGDRVLPEPPGRLDADEDVPEGESRHHDLPAVHVELARRLPSAPRPWLQLLREARTIPRSVLRPAALRLPRAAPP